ncbi:hypothetical protein [Streptomyces sp.]|uniref:hypothetical protein n=1 Tax=Streptomyces sp. TaxID=1931 RepID=UPI002F42B06F
MTAPRKKSSSSARRKSNRPRKPRRPRPSTTQRESAPHDTAPTSTSAPASGATDAAPTATAAAGTATAHRPRTKHATKPRTGHTPPRTYHPVATTAPRPTPPRTPEAAFDALYARTATALLRQLELLTGDPVFAGQAMARGFDLAWQRWPEVARDADPVGWVRAAAYEYALAPWRRWVPGHRPHPRTPDGELGAALLDLQPAHRRAVLLHDGLGLGLRAAAAEAEASTAATAERIARAREALTAAVPDMDDARLPIELVALLGRGLDREPPLGAADVRDASERGVRRRTVGVFALTALIAVATMVTVLVGPAPAPAPSPAPAPAPSPAPGPGPGAVSAPSGSGSAPSGSGQHDGVGPPPAGERTHAVTP